MGAAGPLISLFSGIDQQAGSFETNRLKTLVESQDAEANIELARTAAADAIQRGQADAAKTRFSAQQAIARQKVAFGASGVDASVGTPVSLGASTAAMAELDARTIENNAAREAWGYAKTEQKIRRQQKLNKTMQNLEKWKLGIGGPGVTLLGALGVSPWEEK